MLPALIAAAILSAVGPDPLEANEAIVRAVGVAAYSVGMCEAFVSPPTARAMIERLSGSELPEGPERALIRDVTARMYMVGRLDPRRDVITAEACSDLVRRAADGMGAALMQVRAIESAEP